MDNTPVLDPTLAGEAEPFPLSTAGRGLLAVLAVAAATIHLVMVPAHAAEWLPEGLAFALAGWFGLAFATGVVAKPSKRWLLLGLLANVAFIAAWAVTRFVSMPFGPGAGTTETAGLVDLTTVGLEAALVIGCAVLMVRPRLGERIQAGALVMASVIPIGVLTLTTAVVASPDARGHAHAGGGDHVEAAGTDPNHAHDATGDGSVVPAGMATEDPSQAHQEPAPIVPYDPTKPLDFGGIPGVTPEQQAAAENLVAITLVKLPQWADYKYAEANGFVSIGDGPTGVEHFMNQEYMADDVILDPDKPESLVFDTTGGTRTLAAVMFMVKQGTPLTDVPDVGGALMQWHTHQNLCFRPNGKIGGLTNAEGKCGPGLVLPVPTPMIHVWIRKHPCGPFAALEGIGGGTIAEGETKLCDEAHGSH